MIDRVGFLIRDGYERDIEYCLLLDHSYRTQNRLADALSQRRRPI